MEEHVDDLTLKKRYLYDYYLQLNVAVVDGSNFLSNEGQSHFIIDQKGPHKSDAKQKPFSLKPSASVFFKFSHRDKSKNVLKNIDQMRMVDNIINKVSSIHSTM